MNTNNPLFPIDIEKIKEAQLVVTTLENARRRKIIDVLENFGSLHLEYLSNHINMDKYATIAHLNALRRIQVIECENRNGETFYQLNYNRLEQIQNALRDFPG